MNEFWAQYDAIRAERRAAQAATELEQEPIIVLEPGRELDAAEIAQLKGALGSVIRRVLARDWRVRVGVSVAQMPAVLYETDGEGHNAGEVRYQPYVSTIYEVLAGLNWKGRVVGFHATWARKNDGSVSFQGARTTDLLYGEVWRPTASKPRKPRDWEVKEAVDPPMAFNAWVKQFAATDAEIRKKQKEEA